jgi:alpha-L-fucosidase
VLGLDASWPLQKSSKEFQDIYFTLYQDFNPTDFNPDEWAELAGRAGMKYFVFTARHHDGFSMFDTQTMVNSIRRVPGGEIGPSIGPVESCLIHFSVMDTLYKRDIVGALVKSFRKRGLGIGLYYSSPDWHDPNFRWDKRNMFYDPTYTKESNPKDWEAFLARVRDQLRELSTHYGKIDELSFDGGLPEDAWSDTVQMIKMVRELQPDVLFRERGIGPYGDFTTPEDRVPKDPFKKPLGLPWEVIVPLGQRWAYQPNDKYKTQEWLLGTLIDVVAKGGNFMPGVSPMANGKFPKETIERLEYVGAWLKVNGEAIYKTRTWDVFGEGDDVRFTRSKDGKSLYVILLKWPGKTFTARSVRAEDGSKITMLGTTKSLSWYQNRGGLTIEFPLSIEKAKPCKQAYVLKVRPQSFKSSYE